MKTSPEPSGICRRQTADESAADSALKNKSLNKIEKMWSKVLKVSKGSDRRENLRDSSENCELCDRYPQTYR
jgi:hypothetical protein